MSYTTDMWSDFIESVKGYLGNGLTVKEISELMNCSEIVVEATIERIENESSSG